MQSKDVQFAAKQKENGNQQLWRLLRAKLLLEMVIQAHLSFEYTKKGDEEKPGLWSDHKGMYDRKYVELVQGLWEKLTTYIVSGAES